jgi:ribose transport system permease protein
MDVGRQPSTEGTPVPAGTNRQDLVEGGTVSEGPFLTATEIRDSPAAIGFTGRMLASWRSFLPVVAVIVMVALVGAVRPAYLSATSAENIMRQGALLTLLSLAAVSAILTGAIDVSIAANATLGGIVVAQLTNSIGPWPAIIAATGICGIAGLAIGVIVTVFRVPSFLVTLGMLSVLDGISDFISNGAPISFATGTLNTLVNEESIPGIPNAALVALLFVGIMVVLIFWTRLGRHIMAVGGNERAAFLSGVRVDRVKVIAFIVGGLLAGIAGIVFTGQALNGVPGGVDPDLLSAIAATVVGGTSFTGGVGGPHRCVLGALVIVVLNSGMDILNVSPFLQQVVYGVVVVAAVALTIDRRRYGTIK